VFKDPDLIFYWIPLIDVIQQTLADFSIASRLRYTAKVKKAGKERVYSHFTTCKWMEKGSFLLMLRSFLF
jgi:hypothetical protein